jgi:hypothetical protein
MLRDAVVSLLPLLTGDTVMVFATSLAAMGIRRFDHQPLPWRITVLTTGLTCAGLVLFVVFDSMPTRMVGQSVLLALTLPLFAEAEGGRAIAGPRPARSLSAAIIAIYGVRVGGTRFPSLAGPAMRCRCGS